MNELNTSLRNDAIRFGLCSGWQNDWSENRNKQELIDMWLRGIDFAIMHNYPTNDFIKEHFEDELLKQNNIFVDCPITGMNLNGKVIVNGDCTGTFTFDGFAACDLYIRHNSNVHIDASRFAKIFINLYDDAIVTIKQRDISKVYVYRHSENCHVKCDGDVLVRESRV